ETASGNYFTNLLDDKASISATQDAMGVHVVTGGALKNVAGTSSGVSFTWTYDFGADTYTKELKVSSGAGLRIVEPFVDDTGNEYAVVGTDAFEITTAAGHTYELKVLSSSGTYALSAGVDRARHWSPFPGLDCYPLTITLGGAGEYTIKYRILQ